MNYLTIALLVPVLALAQQESEHIGIHQLESELHRHDIIAGPEDTTTPSRLLPKIGSAATLSKKVYGWHPYWVSANAYLSYDYEALTHLAYFSYETDATTGGYTTIHDWDTTPIISYAHQRGVEVTLTVTNFGYDQNDMLLSDTVKQELMLSTLVSLLFTRSGDGVNFDLELVRSTQRANLVSFMRRAAARIKAALPDAEISMATPAVDWSGTWDFLQLAQICDYLIVMGYNYYYSGSSTAGPVAPLAGESYNVTRTIDTYLSAGVPAAKLLLAVPWYGYDWPVLSGARKATTVGAGTSRTYAAAEPMAASYGKFFDETAKVPWFVYTVGTAWRQTWYDDSLSLALKYNLVTARDIAGIGIWALSYEGGRSEIWNGIKSAFTPSSVETARGDIPGQPTLMQNYPNPFNPTTVVRYGLPVASHVQLIVYDLLGRQVANLVSETRSAGSYAVEWDGRNDRGEPVSAGVYLYVLRVGSFQSAKQMVLVK